MDESGIHRYLFREYAYAPRGEKVIGEIAGRKFQRANLVAAKLGGRIVAPMSYDENTDSAVFEVRFKRRLLPALPENTVIVMDNASFHRKKELEKLAVNYPVKLIFLPPYSPNLNPIEKVWANMKRWLKTNLYLFSSPDEAIEAAWDYISQVG